MKTYVHLWRYVAEFFVEWETSETKAVDKIKTHFVVSNIFFFRKSRNSWANVEKYCRPQMTI